MNPLPTLFNWRLLWNVLGALGSLFFMMQSNFIFSLTPKESRGRIVDIQMLVIGMFPVGSLLVGILASVFSPQLAVAAMSAIGVTLLIGTTVAFPVLWKSINQG